MKDFDKYHTLIIVPASLKNGANTAMKKYIDKVAGDRTFTAGLWPVGTTDFSVAATYYIACMKIPIWLRIRIESIVNGLNNTNVFIEDIDLEETPERVAAILAELNLMKKPKEGPL